MGPWTPLDRRWHWCRSSRLFRMTAMWLLILGVVLWSPVATHAAQRETATDIDEGAAIFGANCANCHGRDGNDIAGIDLGRGVFRRPLSNQDLVQIIRNGIPGTAMPASGLLDLQASRVVAYLRLMASDAEANVGAAVADRGRGIFEGLGQCLSCHRVNGRGRRVGPDLTEIGRTRRADELKRSIVDPDAQVLASNRFYRVTMKDGTTVTGRLLNLDTFSVQMLDMSERLRSFEKATLRNHSFAEQTLMPSYRNKLSEQDLRDLVSYLKTLKGNP